MEKDKVKLLAELLAAAILRLIANGTPIRKIEHRELDIGRKMRLYIQQPHINEKDAK